MAARPGGVAFDLNDHGIDFSAPSVEPAAYPSVEAAASAIEVAHLADATGDEEEATEAARSAYAAFGDAAALADTAPDETYAKERYASMRALVS